MFILSFSHVNCNTDLRSATAIEPNEVLPFFEMLRADGITEIVYLSTCGRTEFFGNGDVYRLLDLLEKKANAPIKKYARIYHDEKAIHRLFSLCAGLESVAVGEDEILGQVRSAYEFSRTNGFTGGELNEIFQSAIASAKKIKTQTLLSKASVSVASLCATKIKNSFCPDATVLLIGSTGDTIKKVKLNLQSYGFTNIFCTSRSIHQGENSVQYAKRYEHIAEADIVVSATKSPHFTLIYEPAKEYLTDKKSRLFVDLASPKDIDPKFAEEENITLLCLDDFKAIAKENRHIKENEIELARALCGEIADECIKDIFLKDNFEAYCDFFDGNMELLSKVKASLSPTEFKKLITIP